MKTIKLTNINIEIFKESFLNFKKFVSSDIEFNFGTYELSTKLDDFDKWHLVTLAQIYGGDIFRKQNELEIVNTESVNIHFEIDYNLPSVKYTSEWNDEIEFYPAYLNSADFYLIDKLNRILSNPSKQIIKDQIHDFDFGQSVFLVNKYAYFISNKTLVFIKTNGNKARITNLFELNWNEI